jgi:hypothetical protein
MWWTRGTEIVALNTDLTAAYAELETLRARPAVVAPPPVEAVPSDPDAVTPAADAADAPVASGPDVVLVPDGGIATPPAAQAASAVETEMPVQPAATTVAPAATPAVSAPIPVNAAPNDNKAQ